MKELTLGRLKNTDFSDAYIEFLKAPKITKSQKKTMLQLAIVLLNSTNDDIKKLGYRIVLKYSNKTKDYIPLYDISLNEGYIPIAKYLQVNYFNNIAKEDGFFYEYQSAFKENFKLGDIYLTEEQLELNRDFEENNDNSIAVIAPTSYGKSELILSLINTNLNCSICIIVPTKSLLAQTKKRIMNSKSYSGDRKIITHPDMYNPKDSNFIAVLTQERLLRLLQFDKNLQFEHVVVDEAHNLLSKDPRSELLATSLIILNKRNKNFTIKYLSPFLLDSRNISINYIEHDFTELRIDENIKTENFYYYDFSNCNGLKQYDQYIDRHISVGDEKYNSEVDLIIDKASFKNVIYLNRPVHIEKVAKELMKKTNIVSNEQISKAISDISSYLHKDYSLIAALKKGIVYHHGSVPDNIRLYVEYMFSTVSEINYIITTSTLLEGVNIPADTLFMLDYKKGLSKLSHAQFKNLVGRVSRFGEIFDEENGSLEKLEPCVYLIKSSYINENANIVKFLEDTARVDRKYKDEPENVLLTNTQITEENVDNLIKAKEFVENQEPGTIIEKNINRVKTEIGKICYKNSITEFDISEHETEIEFYIDMIKNEKDIISTPEKILEMIANLFIDKIPDNDKYQNLKRLKDIHARNFYVMFLNWKIEQTSYNQMISSFVKYWKKLIQNNRNTLIYVGKWGDEVKKSPSGGSGYRPLWTNIKDKTDVELINLAIVRIKEEQDFLENVLMKFVEALSDLDLIEPRLYSMIKYGTENESLITIVKNGIGLQTAKLLLKEYMEYITLNNIQNTVIISEKILDKMRENNENEIIIFEVMSNIRMNTK